MKNHYLKKAGSILLLGIGTLFYSQEVFSQITIGNTTLNLSYNAAGERVQRKTVVTINPNSVNDPLSAMSANQTSDSLLESYEVPGETSAFDIVLYPNPVGEAMTINISGDIPESMNACIYDMNGNVMLTQTLSSTTTEFNLSSFTSGTYMIEVSSGSTKQKRKLIKL